VWLLASNREATAKTTARTANMNIYPGNEIKFLIFLKKANKVRKYTHCKKGDSKMNNKWVKIKLHPLSFDNTDKIFIQFSLIKPNT
jgi:hypothetical protein